MTTMEKINAAADGIRAAGGEAALYGKEDEHDRKAPQAQAW